MNIGMWWPWFAAFLGFPLGGSLALAVGGPVTSPRSGIVGGLAAGLIIGAAQWLALRRIQPVSPAWIAYTALAMGLGLSLSLAVVGTGMTYLEVALRGAVTGLAIGALQWIPLRTALPGSASWIWIPVVASTWSAGWCITKSVGVHLTRHFAVFGSSGAIVFQLLTGAALLYLKSRIK